MQDKDLISYKPHLEIPKDYSTEGILQRLDDVQVEQDSRPAEEIFEEIESSIEQAKDIVTRFPEEFIPAVNTIIKTLEFIFVHIDKDEYLENKKDLETNIEIVETESPKYEDVNSGFKPSDKLTPTKIKNKPIDKTKVINDNYCNALLDIVNHYYARFEKISSNYFMRLGMVMTLSEDQNIGFAELPYKYVPVQNNKDLQHISDYLVRSQIQRNQTMRMYNKLFSHKASLTHMKACEASKEMLMRYVAENHVKNSSYSNAFSNIVLKQTIVAYEDKLDYNLLQLYKYLNSSVILLEKNFEMYLEECQAKSILIKEEGIKL